MPADGLVVITGVGHEGQVGEAIARAFAATGAPLAIIDRTPDNVQARAAALRAAAPTPATVTGYACDLTDAAATAAVAAAIGGAIATLVHVAGGFAANGPIGDSDPAVFAQQVAINLTTAYVVTRAFFPRIRDGGSIVYFASASALPDAPVSGLSGYVAAKSAVIGLMRSVAAEGHARGIRANAVAPTTIRTTVNLRAMGADAPYVEREAVADAVLFLSSPAARAVTGQVVALRRP